MNCLNFVYQPKGFASRAEMDALYNAQVRRFYDSKGYRRRFAQRLWQHRWSLWHVLKNLPKTFQAARYFSSSKADLERVGQAFAPHPRQPHGLTPNLSPELGVDGIAALAKIKVSRRRRPEASV
jgi:magnesium-protoporphyrin IX monomethyl ester (oxidative) cyclase